MEGGAAQAAKKMKSVQDTRQHETVVDFFIFVISFPWAGYNQTDRKTGRLKAGITANP
jgi:hypothetical protein